ncbi:dTDP-glucose 4,6-dehydratase [Spongiivirga sp. MCCC 1A20706]|uniref:dTDP-glucose 4,6-dehydratase n=1 Tax=Spongiivirga sp. MCCC 1A20706 TaxID=3160963 RepID=UPI003977AF7F
MQQTKILVTGGAGFIGSNFTQFLLESDRHVQVVNLDALTYAGSLDNCKVYENNARYSFIRADIRDKAFIENLFKEQEFTGVIHFAAESHVDNSIDAPGIFIETNVLGTFNLLEAARKYQPTIRFHHISTDEVYGSLDKEGFFTEKTSYAPNSPYSASKASSDFLVRSYFHTYKMDVVTSNCSNNYGPKQHDEKLIPVIIRKALSGEQIPIYGDGTNIRDWLYVIDHCKGILEVFKKGKSGETYNIGGGNEYTNLQIANMICELLDERRSKHNSYKSQITFVKDRQGHDFRYAIDASKIENELNWKADEKFETGIRKTVNWYLNKYN